MMSKPFLLVTSESKLESALVNASYEKYRAKQILEGLYKGKTINELNIKQDLKNFLYENFSTNQTSIKSVFESEKGATKKFLFCLNDNQLVEGVFMEYHHGNSFCISTQVGCKMGCVFCTSGKNGFLRNIQAGEMIEFILLAEKHTDSKISNIVLMGSGEPLDNFDEVELFLDKCCSPSGLNISARSVSVSTCGIVPKMYELAELPQKITLSISLHATTDGTRKQIMKIANKYTIKEVIAAAQNYFDKTGRRVAIEYTLIKDVNSSIDDAKRLHDLTKNLCCHINLINLNSTDTDLMPCPKSQSQLFLKILLDLGTSASIRRVLGDDVGGACGQLRGKYVEEISAVTDLSKD